MRSLIVIVFTVALAACITDFGEEPEYIHFNNLNVGQQSVYVRLYCKEYGNTASNIYELVPDTLVVSVVGRDSLGFVFEEHMTRYSQKTLDSYNDTLDHRYHVRIARDTLRVIGYSHLFWSTYLAKPALQLSPIGGRRFDMNGWKLSGDPFRQVALWGYVLNAKVHERTYPRANVFIKLFEADAYGPPVPWSNTVIGETYIYSEEYGIIRSRMVGMPTFDEGLCWDLVLR
jgi:hypothetical protein